MKIQTDELVNDSRHQAYTEFDRRQFIVNLDLIGEKIIIVHEDINGKRTDLKEFLKVFASTHINCQWQDKGTKQEINPDA